MVRTLASQVASGLTLLSLAIVLTAAGRVTLGAEGQETVKKVLSKKTRARGRLPAYYNQVVTGEQREKIYEIQEQYQPKIEALDAQLKALKKEREERITAVLTPEQRQKVEEAATKAKQKRPAEIAPTAPPAEAKR